MTIINLSTAKLSLIIYPAVRAIHSKFNKNKIHSWNTTDLFAGKKNSINNYLFLSPGCFSSNENPQQPTSLADASSMTLLSPMLQPAPTSSALLSDVVIVEPIQEVATKKSPGSPQELIQVTRSAQTNAVANGRNRTVRRNNFESDNFDLSVADREEGPIPAFVLPGNWNIFPERYFSISNFEFKIFEFCPNFFITCFNFPQGHIRGCPRCVTDTPKDLKMLYCQSKSVYLAETRPARGHRLRLVNNVSLQHARFVKMNSSVDMLLEPNCQCSFFQQGI